MSFCRILVYPLDLLVNGTDTKIKIRSYEILIAVPEAVILVNFGAANGDFRRIENNFRFSGWRHNAQYFI